MAFVSDKLAAIAYANGFTLWQYRSADDDLAAITGAGYFDEVADLLRPADLVVIEDSTGTAGIRRVADVSAGTVTVGALA